MKPSAPVDYLHLGIEHVAIVETFEVASVDLMTRSRAHAIMLERRFGVRPFRFAHGSATLHAFPRLPAADARDWLEDQGLRFVVTENALRPDGPTTWVQGSTG